MSRSNQLDPLYGYTLSFEGAVTHRVKHPERTAKRCLASWRVEYMVFATTAERDHWLTHNELWRACPDTTT